MMLINVALIIVFGTLGYVLSKRFYWDKQRARQIKLRAEFARIRDSGWVLDMSRENALLAQIKAQMERGS